jgi:hypothetical protein
MPIPKPDFSLATEYRQRAFDLDLPEVESECVSVEEARRRSEAARQALEIRRGELGNKSFAWLEDYFSLLDGGWPWRQAAYIAWASSPKDGRMPETQDKLAREYLGLNSDRVIATWRSKNPAIVDMIAFLQAAPLWEHRADQFRALAEGANKAGTDYKFFNHLKLAMEMRGDYVPRSELEALLRGKSESGDLADVSREELERQARMADNGIDNGETDDAQGVGSEE